MGKQVSNYTMDGGATIFSNPLPQEIINKTEQMYLHFISCVFHFFLLFVTPLRGNIHPHPNKLGYALLEVINYHNFDNSVSLYNFIFLFCCSLIVYPRVHKLFYDIPLDIHHTKLWAKLDNIFSVPYVTWFGRSRSSMDWLSTYVCECYCDLKIPKCEKNKITWLNPYFFNLDQLCCTFV